MNVIYTDQSYENLDELTDFLMSDSGWSLEKLLDLRARLLDKADGLDVNYDHYQMEVHLEHLGKGHRRALVGLSRSFIE